MVLPNTTESFFGQHLSVANTIIYANNNVYANTKDFWYYDCPRYYLQRSFEVSLWSCVNFSFLPMCKMHSFEIHSGENAH